MVCYLCLDYSLEDLTNCNNRRCKAYFHRSCWEKYLRINNLPISKCQVCMYGSVNIKNPNIATNGEVTTCCEVSRCGEVNECASVKAFLKYIFMIH